jgi:hypothetical protein
MDPSLYQDSFQQLVAGIAAELSAPRRPPQQPAPPPRRDVVEVSARDLLSAIRDSRPHVIGSDVSAQHQDFPWGAVLGIGIIASLALGISIALLATRR